MGSELVFQDAMSYFQMAGWLALGLIVTGVCFRTASAFIGQIPLIGAIFAFGLVLFVLFLGMGFFYMTEFWGWSASTQLHTKHLFVIGAFALALWASIWARQKD